MGPSVGWLSSFLKKISFFYRAGRFYLVNQGSFDPVSRSRPGPCAKIPRLSFRV